MGNQTKPDSATLAGIEACYRELRELRAVTEHGFSQLGADLSHLRKAQANTERKLSVAAAVNDLKFDAITWIVLGAISLGSQGYVSAIRNAPDWVRAMVPGLEQPEQVTPAQAAGAQQVVAKALPWAGQHYKRGQTARCADFVRDVLKQAGVNVGVAAGSMGPLMADSFHGPELGELILDSSQLLPGDIVMFQNTYQGPGRILPGANGRARITHVGIYVGDGLMIDRPTSNSPVKHRPITSFTFHSALRPSAYQAAMVPSSTPSDETLKRAIGRAEGTRDRHGNPTAAYGGHTDPGNRKRNLGSFSYQHGASSPAEADQRWLEVLRKAEARIQAQAQEKFGQPLSKAAMIAALDSYTQSPNAGLKFVGHLASHDPTPEQLIEARTAALNESRAEKGGPPLNVPADQARRVNALLEQL